MGRKNNNGGRTAAKVAHEFLPISALISETELGLQVICCPRDACNGRYRFHGTCDGKPMYRSESDSGIVLYFWNGEEPCWWLGPDFGLEDGEHDGGSCFCRHPDGSAAEPPAELWSVPVYGEPVQGMRVVPIVPIEQFALSVILLSGETFTVHVTLSETIGSVKSKIQEMKGFEIEHQRLFFNEAELADDSELGGSGLSDATPLQLVMVVTTTFDLRLAATHGPNSPRFGCQSSYTWEMKCDCGHTEFWRDSASYDFYSLEKQRTKKCRMCGGGCRNKSSCPGDVPTKFPIAKRL
eukprot:TRINITY_DN76335_c0_g1_i1.p1 TRINITY_DN76335_c0_g1~~TRINITY_DN76335_c0_g1_i1.p1  ORF type:complete len:295 (+),score=27.85 TRINITY_DN76335_c0_g1_i1:74-958(+)